MSVEIRPVESKRVRKDFLRVPTIVMGDDPNYVPALDLEREEFINTRKNPFFEHGQAQLFVAYRNGKPVGRISAQVDHLHLERYRDTTGFFGFFDVINDREASDALLVTAENWLRARGLKRVLGPYSFNINGESGVLVDGFDTPPSIMMNHNPPHYDPLLAGAGYAKAKDLFAWKYIAGDLTEGVRLLAQMTREAKGLRIRSINKARLHDEVRVIMSIFNEAWSNNWGYLPLTEAELEKMAEDMKLIMDPDLVFVAEVDGEPAAMALSIPNINEALKTAGGKPLPVSLAKLLWWKYVSKPKSLRLVLLGIRPKFRGREDLKYLSVLLYELTHVTAVGKGIKLGELSWTLEDNVKINKGIEMMGGIKYKTYRVYEKGL